VPASWDFEADVVIIGAGATGLPAAIRARDQGASVLVVEANYDIGGHALLSGGNVPLGGGTSAQRKYNIEDSPDSVFADLTDWTIVQPNGWPDYRYNDRAVMRAFADHCSATYEFLVANGVNFKDVPPDNSGAHSTGNSAPRENHAVWTEGTGPGSPSGRDGAGLMRPLEASARAKGVKFLLSYKMTSVVRAVAADGSPGRVIGITAAHTPRFLPGDTTPLSSYQTNGNVSCTTPRISIRATKGVILATGGSTSNVNFRRMFDPRLTEVYQVAGEPYTFQDASGELAAMAIGASLWGLAGTPLRRDNRWSIAYSEELNFPISATLQSTDRHHGILGQECCHFQLDS
jgi:predicted oxidoreductase